MAFSKTILRHYTMNLLCAILWPIPVHTVIGMGKPDFYKLKQSGDLSQLGSHLYHAKLLKLPVGARIVFHAHARDASLARVMRAGGVGCVMNVIQGRRDALITEAETVGQHEGHGKVSPPAINYLLTLGEVQGETGHRGRECGVSYPRTRRAAVNPQWLRSNPRNGRR